MAPEYHEEGAVSLKCDIYSLGVIIMQMVTGHKDHPNIKSVRTILSNHLRFIHVQNLTFIFILDVILLEGIFDTLQI